MLGFEAAEWGRTGSKMLAFLLQAQLVPSQKGDSFDLSSQVLVASPC